MKPTFEELNGFRGKAQEVIDTSIAQISGPANKTLFANLLVNQKTAAVDIARLASNSDEVINHLCYRLALLSAVSIELQLEVNELKEELQTIRDVKADEEGCYPDSDTPEQ
jgi:hypothetical protein